MQRFGAFYMDYLYTMENSSGKGIIRLISLFLYIYDVLYIHILHFLQLPVPYPLTVLCQTSPLESWSNSLSYLSHSHLVFDPPCPHSHPKLTWGAIVRIV